MQTGAHCTVTHSYSRRENLNDLACLHRSAACQSELALFLFYRTSAQLAMQMLCLSYDKRVRLSARHTLLPNQNDAR